jgi:hypothetical protein
MEEGTGSWGRLKRPGMSKLVAPAESMRMDL